MGVHTGEAERRDGDDDGSALNRTAGADGRRARRADPRLADDGRVVRDVMNDMLVIDLGETRLRDLFEPERAFQLGGDGLDRTFPPLLSLDARRRRTSH